METTLHRQLKALYAPDDSRQEVTIDGFRIDAVDGDRLIEIQYGSLSAIRDKVRQLLQTRNVLVVKPLAARKYLVTRARQGGPIKTSRYSPLRETYHHLFQEFVHFVDVFPHPRLTLELILTDQEEHRISAKRRRWNGKAYRVEDRTLRAVTDQLTLRTTADLVGMVPDGLPEPFSTADLAQAAGIPRWLAQKMAYTLRKTGAATVVGKCRNAQLYRIERPRRRRRAA